MKKFSLVLPYAFAPAGTGAASGPAAVV
jgi:hypothetical protein